MLLSSAQLEKQGIINTKNEQKNEKFFPSIKKVIIEGEKNGKQEIHFFYNNYGEKEVLLGFLNSFLPDSFHSDTLLTSAAAAKYICCNDSKHKWNLPTIWAYQSLDEYFSQTFSDVSSATK